MNRRELRDKLEDHLTAAAVATREALDRYKVTARKVEAARTISGILRDAYAALELAECYRQLTALEIDEASLVKGRLIPAVPPWKATP